MSAQPPRNAAFEPYRRHRSKTQHAGRRLHGFAIVGACHQRKRLSAGALGRVDEVQLLAYQLPNRIAPARKGLARLPVDGVQLQQAPPALRQQRRVHVIGKLAKLRKLPVAKTQHRKPGTGRQLGLGLFQTRQKLLGRAGRIPIAIGGGEDEQALGLRVVTAPVIEFSRMHAQTGLAQSVVQRVGKAPSAVVFAADQNHCVRCAGGTVADQTRHRLVPLPPSQRASGAQKRHAQRAQRQQQAQPPQTFTGVELVYQLIGGAKAVVRQISQKFAAAGVDVALALAGRQRINARRVIRAGIDQFAQVVHIGGQQRRQSSDRHGHCARHLRRKIWLVLHAIGNQRKRRRRQIHAGQRRQQQPQQHHPAHLGVPALHKIAPQRIGQMPPAAHALDQQYRARHRQHQHGQRQHARRYPPGGVQQPRAVQIFDPARQQRAHVGGDALAGVRIDAVHPGLAVLAVVNDQRAVRRALNLFDPRIVLRHPASQRRHVDLAVGRGGVARSFEHRFERQHRAAERQHHEQHSRPQSQQ